MERRIYISRTHRYARNRFDRYFRICNRWNVTLEPCVCVRARKYVFRIERYIQIRACASVCECVHAYMIHLSQSIPSNNPYVLFHFIWFFSVVVIFIQTLHLKLSDCQYSCHFVFHDCGRKTIQFNSHKMECGGTYTSFSREWKKMFVRCEYMVVVRCRSKVVIYFVVFLFGGICCQQWNNSNVNVVAAAAAAAAVTVVVVVVGNNMNGKNETQHALKWKQTNRMKLKTTSKVCVCVYTINWYLTQPNGTEMSSQLQLGTQQWINWAFILLIAREWTAKTKNERET